MMRKRTRYSLLIVLGIGVAGGLVLSLHRPVKTARVISCYRNLNMIDIAKERAGQEHNVQQPNLFTVAEADPMWVDQILPYMRDMPYCPAGGTYTIGFYWQKPMCSLHGVYGWDEMNRAAFAGDAGEIRNLMNDHYGPDGVNFMSSLPWTPLHSAALAGHTEVVNLLIQKGARVNPMTRLGQTPLDLATDSAVIDTLKRHGGREVFNVYAKRSEDVAKARQLLDVSLSINHTDPDTYIFSFGISNQTDHAITVGILSSMVCDIKNGHATTAEMPSSHADAWLCPPGTVVQLGQRASHLFDLTLVYELERRAGWFGVHSKATGFWNDTGYSGSSASWLSASTLATIQGEVGKWRHSLDH